MIYSLILLTILASWDLRQLKKNKSHNNYLLYSGLFLITAGIILYYFSVPFGFSLALDVLDLFGIRY